MIRSLRSVVLLGLMLLALAVGCSQRVPLYGAAATFPSGVHVRVYEAYISGDRLYVKMWMMNTTALPITIDRNGMALKLPGGQVLGRSVGVTTQHRPYILAGGQGREVFVDFRSDGGFEGLTGANVVVGGISFGQDPTPRIVGELPLSTTYVQSEQPVMTAPPAGGAPPSPPAGGAPPPPPTAQPSTL
jgi:hypothetical protein